MKVMKIVARILTVVDKQRKSLRFKPFLALFCYFISLVIFLPFCFLFPPFLNFVSKSKKELFSFTHSNVLLDIHVYDVTIMLDHLVED
jgi:hypothetical protein